MKWKKAFIVVLVFVMCSVNAAAQVSGTLGSEYMKDDGFAVFYKDGGFVDCPIVMNREGASREILPDGTLKVKAVKAYGGITIGKASAIGLTADNKNDAYLCFDLKAENMSTKQIRALLWFGSEWSPTEFGKFQWDIENTDQWQTIKVPLKDVNRTNADDWTKVKGIRIDPYEAWNAETISASNPAYLYLKNIRISMEQNYESSISVSAYYSDNADAEAESISAGKTLVAKAALTNGMQTKSSEAVMLMAVYQDDFMVSLQAAELNAAPETDDEKTISYTFGDEVDGVSAYIITCDKFSNMQAVCDVIRLEAEAAGK